MAPPKPLTNKSLKQRLRRVENYIKQSKKQNIQFTTESPNQIEVWNWNSIIGDANNKECQTYVLFPAQNNGYSPDLFTREMKQRIVMKTLNFTCRMKPYGTLGLPAKYRITIAYGFAKKKGSQEFLRTLDVFDDPTSILSTTKLSKTSTTHYLQEKQQFTVIYDELFQTGTVKANQTTDQGGRIIVSRQLHINRPNIIQKRADYADLDFTAYPWRTYADTTRGWLQIFTMVEAGTGTAGVRSGMFDWGQFVLSFY